MTAQRVNKNVLDGLVVDCMIAIHSAAALGCAEVNPVAGFIGRPPKAGTVHEGFEKQRPVTVECMPVLRQPARGQGQDLARQSFHLHPGQNKKPALIYDELKIAFPLLHVPSDPGIAGRHHPCGAGKLQAGEIAAGQLAGFDEISQVGAEGNAVAKVMVTVDVLLEQRIEIPVRSLDKMKDQGIEIAGASGHRGLGVALRSTDNMPRTGRCRGTKAGQGQNPLIPEVFEKRAALFVLEFSGRAFPLEKFAKGFGQLGNAEVGKVTNRLTDEFEFGSPKITAREGNLRWQQDCSPLLLSLPYPKAKRMSRTKCSQAKIFRKPGTTADLGDSDCTDESAKLYRQFAIQASSGRVDRAAKTADMRRANIRKTDNRVG
jgi:hypothetical protein